MKSGRSLIGYCDPLTVRPGDSVHFKVSSHSEQPYQAELVKIRNADRLTPANRFSEKILPSAFAGRYPGREQAIHTGSCIEIPDNQALTALQSFTAPLTTSPTTPMTGRQQLLSCWTDLDRKGWAVILDSRGFPTLMLADSGGRHYELSTQIRVPDGVWTFIAVSFDAVAKSCTVFSHQLEPTGNTLLDWPVRRSLPLPEDFVPVQDGPISVAAVINSLPTGGKQPLYCFNGKVERPRLFAGVPTVIGFKTHGEELLALGRDPIPETSAARLVADWDFSQKIGTAEIVDRGPYGLHGRTINLPLRAVRGQTWTGDTLDWRDDPSQYAAIRFHDDDLYDAQWQTDFSYTVPNDLPSGLYAARIQDESTTDHICFFVAPERGDPRNDVAVLLPTVSYLAYANHRLNISWPDRFPKVYTNEDDSAYLETHSELGHSLYDYHSDGSEVNYASRLRPLIHIRPGAQAYNFVADTDIIDWLEHESVGFDLITDDLLHAEGYALLKDYRVVITGTHPEYTTTPMLDAVEQFTESGGRLMYMGANGFFWVTSYHQSQPGVIEVRRMMAEGEGRHEFDGAAGSLWALNDRAPQKLLGVGFVAMAFFGPSFYQRVEPIDEAKLGFIFQGVDGDVIGDFGNHFNGAVGEEIDRTDAAMGTPEDTIVLARCTTLGGIVEPDDFYAAEDVYAEMTFRTTAGGGAVFSTGSIAWSSALNHNNFDNDVATITRNVLRRFASPEAFDA